jgi:hypothetical protein
MKIFKLINAVILIFTIGSIHVSAKPKSKEKEGVGKQGVLVETRLTDEFAFEKIDDFDLKFEKPFVLANIIKYKKIECFVKENAEDERAQIKMIGITNAKRPWKLIRRSSVGLGDRDPMTIRLSDWHFTHGNSNGFPSIDLTCQYKMPRELETGANRERSIKECESEGGELKSKEDNSADFSVQRITYYCSYENQPMTNKEFIEMFKKEGIDIKLKTKASAYQEIISRGQPQQEYLPESSGGEGQM